MKERFWEGEAPAEPHPAGRSQASAAPPPALKRAAAGSVTGAGLMASFNSDVEAGCGSGGPSPSQCATGGEESAL
jgi:hypothetical protein